MVKGSSKSTIHCQSQNLLHTMTDGLFHYTIPFHLQNRGFAMQKKITLLTNPARLFICWCHMAWFGIFCFDSRNQIKNYLIQFYIPKDFNLIIQSSATRFEFLFTISIFNPIIAKINNFDPLKMYKMYRAKV